MSDGDMLTAVTADEWALIRPDVEKLLKIKQKPGEGLVVYAGRLAKDANDPKKVGDDAWETLEDLSQRWINGFNAGAEKGEPPLLPPGMATTEETGGEGEAPAPAAESVPAKPKKTGGAKAKAPAKKEPVKKTPVKKVPAKKVPAKKAVKVDGAKSRGRPTLFSDGDKITIKEKEPFRTGTASAIGFAKMKTGMTVAKAIEAGTPRRLIRWSKICDYIEVAPAK